MWQNGCHSCFTTINDYQKNQTSLVGIPVLKSKIVAYSPRLNCLIIEFLFRAGITMHFLNSLYCTCIFMQRGRQPIEQRFRLPALATRRCCASAQQTTDIFINWQRLTQCNYKLRWYIRRRAPLHTFAIKFKFTKMECYYIHASAKHMWALSKFSSMALQTR